MRELRNDAALHAPPAFLLEKTKPRRENNVFRDR